LFNLGVTSTNSYPGSDYPWRAILPNRSEVLKLMVTLGNSVDYPNFKGHITSRSDQKDRLDRYHKIWAMMAEEKES
jgi:hypothetical protein